jgi:excisionase family DNA binding protein
VPPEVEAAIDKRSSMAAVGNLNDFIKFQMASGMTDRGSGGGGSGAGMASELAVGMAIAQQMVNQPGGILGTPSAGGGAGAATPPPPRAAMPAGGGLPELLTPQQVAEAIGVSESDVMSIIESGELKAKKIGAAFRVKRADLQTFLDQ